MSKKINGLLIVEGKDDEARIKSFFNCDVYITNGYDIDETDLNFLKAVSKKKPLLILTDPDEAGEKIRKTLESNLDNTQSVFVDVNECNKNNKHGVAECSEKELRKCLEPYYVEYTENGDKITAQDLFELGLTGSVDSKEKRQVILDKYSIKNCNAKKLANLLNILEIKLQDLKKDLGL